MATQLVQEARSSLANEDRTYPIGRDVPAYDPRYDRRGGRIKIYLAASFSRQAEMRVVAARLEGVTITSRWLFENQGMKHGNSRRKFMMRCAFTDLQDVQACDILVRFADDLSPITIPSHIATGARHFEMGYAAALGKTLIVVGGHQNVFDFLPNVVHLKDTDALVQYFDPQEIN